MLVQTGPSLFETIVALPARQQKRLADEARQYYQALDRAIGKVLAPSVGRTGDQFMAVDEVIPHRCGRRQGIRSASGRAEPRA